MSVETTKVDCRNCGREITEIVVGGEPLNTICRTCAATGRGPAGSNS